MQCSSVMHWQTTATEAILTPLTMSIDDGWTLGFERNIASAWHEGPLGSGRHVVFREADTDLRCRKKHQTSQQVILSPGSQDSFTTGLSPMALIDYCRLHVEVT